MTNSAFHVDHRFGEVDIAGLEKALIASTNTTKLIVMHHHSIPAHDDNRSATRNSFDLLTLSLHHRATAIMHGHRHAEHILTFGRNGTQIVGVGSLFYPLRPNHSNQFNLLEIEKGTVSKILKFRYQADRAKDGRIGCFCGSETKTL